jgi:hypothetical protein
MSALAAREERPSLKRQTDEAKGMLTYYYTLISDPCGRTVDSFLAYARDHPGCLLTLAPADLRAMQRAIAKAWSDDEHEYSAESEEFMLVLVRRTLN